MLRASLSSLIKSSSGQRWIWVHCVLIVWLLGTWVAGLVWVAWGGLKYRRQAVESTLHQARLDAASKRREPDGLPRAKPTAARVGYPAEGMIASGGGPPKSSALCPNGASDDGGDSDGGLDNADDGKTGPRGWKHRTVLVANIPPDMRDPDVLRAYFSDGLRGVLKRRARKARARAQGNAGQGGVAARIAKRARTSADGREGVGLRDDPSEEDDLDGDDAGFAGEEGGRTGVVEDVVVVRRLLELHKLRERRLDVLGQLEQAHVVLGRNVLGALAAWRRAEGKDGAEPPTAAGEKAVGAADDEKDVGAGFYGDAQDWTETERMIILDRELGRFLDVEADGFWTVRPVVLPSVSPAPPLTPTVSPPPPLSLAGAPLAPARAARPLPAPALRPPLARARAPAPAQRAPDRLPERQARAPVAVDRRQPVGPARPLYAVVVRLRHVLPPRGRPPRCPQDGPAPRPRALLQRRHGARLPRPRMGASPLGPNFGRACAAWR